MPNDDFRPPTHSDQEWVALLDVLDCVQSKMLDLAVMLGNPNPLGAGLSTGDPSWGTTIFRLSIGQLRHASRLALGYLDQPDMMASYAQRMGKLIDDHPQVAFIHGPLLSGFFLTHQRLVNALNVLVPSAKEHP